MAELNCSNTVSARHVREQQQRRPRRKARTIGFQTIGSLHGSQVQRVGYHQPEVISSVSKSLPREESRAVEACLAVSRTFQRGIAGSFRDNFGILDDRLALRRRVPDNDPSLRGGQPGGANGMRIISRHDKGRSLA